ncbi:MAG: hypothetical protein QM813_21920 [Verrucomicrobiota bacterium]
MKSKKHASPLKASNTDADGKPLRLDLGGTRDISKPYAKPRWRLAYIEGIGAVFVPAGAEIKAKHPSDFFTD